MKTFKKRISYVIYIVLAIVLSSCIMRPIDNYQGGIIHEKDAPPSGYRFLLELENDVEDRSYLKTVYVSNRDWMRYDIGDTIN